MKKSSKNEQKNRPVETFRPAEDVKPLLKWVTENGLNRSDLYNGLLRKYGKLVCRDLGETLLKGPPSFNVPDPQEDGLSIAA